MLLDKRVHHCVQAKFRQALVWCGASGHLLEDWEEDCVIEPVSQRHVLDDVRDSIFQLQQTDFIQEDVEIR